MRTVLVLAVVVPSIASADRSTTVNIGGMIGGIEHQVDESAQMQPAGGLRLTLSFEHPQPPAEETTTDVTIVPEIVAAAVMDASSGEAMLGVGARGEVRVSLRDRGWRTAFYAAGRALVVGAHQNAAGEFALGEYFYLADRFRFGGEGSLLLRRSDELYSGSQHGILVTAYLGWSM